MHGLRDVPFTGNPFTWSNHRKSTKLVKTRIDRALANNNWFTSFKDSVINNLLPHGSDHAPIPLHIHLPDKTNNKPYRFYKVWLSNPLCKEVFRKSCHLEESLHLNELPKKIQQTTEALRDWNHKSFGHVKTEIRRTQNLLQKAKNSPRQDTTLIKSLEDQLNKWYDKSAQITYHQSREQILWFDDRNNKYFHNKANFRRRRNHIDTLQDSNGNWISNKEEI